MLNSVLWNRNILHGTKKGIFKALLQNVSLYGAETWTVTRKQAERLLAVEMDIWRRSARISRKDKIRSTR